MKKSSKKNKQNKGERTDTTVIGGCKVTDNRKVKSVEETKPDDEMADQRESSNRAAQLTRRQRKNRNKNSVSAKQGEYKEDTQGRYSFNYVCVDMAHVAFSAEAMCVDMTHMAVKVLKCI